MNAIRAAQCEKCGPVVRLTPGDEPTQPEDLVVPWTHAFTSIKESLEPEWCDDGEGVLWCSCCYMLQSDDHTEDCVWMILRGLRMGWIPTGKDGMERLPLVGQTVVVVYQPSDTDARFRFQEFARLEPREQVWDGRLWKLLRADMRHYVIPAQRILYWYPLPPLPEVKTDG